MRLRLGRPRSVLVVAPHPDDETIGAFGLIRAARAAGARVRVLVVSDGAGSHRRSVRWPRRRLVAERRRETRRAMRRLGVHAGEIVFLGLPDGALADRAASVLLPRHLTRGVRLLVGPSVGDAHPDHVAVARAIRASRVSARRLAYHVWPAGHRPCAFRNALSFPAGAAGKRSAIRCHRTQMGMIRDDPAGFALSCREIGLFARPIEYFAEARR